LRQPLHKKKIQLFENIFRCWCHSIIKPNQEHLIQFDSSVQASIATNLCISGSIVHATVGDLEGKRVVELAPMVTRCNTASISRKHNTSSGFWRDSKGQHVATCVLTQWAEDCQSIKFSLNV